MGFKFAYIGNSFVAASVLMLSSAHAEQTQTAKLTAALGDKVPSSCGEHFSAQFSGFEKLSIDRTLDGSGVTVNVSLRDNEGVYNRTLTYRPHKIQNSLESANGVTIEGVETYPGENGKKTVTIVSPQFFVSTDEGPRILIGGIKGNITMLTPYDSTNPKMAIERLSRAQAQRDLMQHISRACNLGLIPSTQP